METIDLTTAEYWEGNEVDIRLNPTSKIDLDGIREALQKQDIQSAVILATSGTQGDPKLVVLEKQALLESARTVNAYCDINAGDIWLAGLSTFHVGGLAIYARSLLSGSRINEMEWHQWTRDGEAFLKACRDATLTSLTPVHLYDLVQSKISPPQSLRGVFVGGGRLSEDLAAQAGDLGWPIWTTYGMTEAGSQIATSLEGELEWLPILPHWETQISTEGRLQIRGKSLMKGFFSQSSSAPWQWNEGGGENGYYTTGDVAETRGSRLKVLGRADDMIKIYGELVSIGHLEGSLAEDLGKNVILIAEPDARTGAQLIVVVEATHHDELNHRVEVWSRSREKYIRIEQIYFLPEFPRTPSGKIDRVATQSSLS